MSVEQELDFLREVAERFEGEGYQVLLEPSPSKLPKLLRQYQPDLLAMKGNERVVVEIKKSSEPLASHRLNSLRRSVAKIPGWRLEIVWYGDIRTRSSKQGRNLSDTEIRQWLADIPVGRTKQSKNAELMALWACFEAAVRNRLAALGQVEKSPIPPSSLVRKAISFGLLSQNDLSVLDDLGRLRNQVSHGYRVQTKGPMPLKRLRKTIAQVLKPVRH